MRKSIRHNKRSLQMQKGKNMQKIKTELQQYLELKSKTEKENTQQAIQIIQQIIYGTALIITIIGFWELMVTL